MPPCLFWRASGFGYFSALAADMGDFGRSQQTIKADLLRGFNSRMTVQGNPVKKKLPFFSISYLFFYFFCAWCRFKITAFASLRLVADFMSRSPQHLKPPAFPGFTSVHHYTHNIRFAISGCQQNPDPEEPGTTPQLGGRILLIQ